MKDVIVIYLSFHGEENPFESETQKEKHSTSFSQKKNSLSPPSQPPIHIFSLSKKALSFPHCSSTDLLELPPSVSLRSAEASKSQTEATSSANRGWIVLRSAGLRSERAQPRSSAIFTAAPLRWWVSRNGTPFLLILILKRQRKERKKGELFSNFFREIFKLF